MLWIDGVRAVAIFMVVLLHSAAPLLYKYNEVPLEYWFTGNVYDSLVRSCVPLFFMVSGALLLKRDEPITDFIRKRFSKVIIPFVFWSLFFVFWASLYELRSGIFASSFYSLVFQPSYYHLWFLYTLVGLYLYMPILRKIVNNSNNSLLVYFIILWFVAVAVVPSGERVSGLDSFVDLSSISGYVGYLVLGLLLSKKTYNLKQATLAMAAFVIAVCVTIFGTYYLAAQNEGVFDGYFYENLSPNVIVASGSLFVLIKFSIESLFKGGETCISKSIRSVSACSFGIYFIHVVFLYLLKNGDLGLTLSAFVGDPVYSVPATAIVVFIASYSTVLLMKNIPFIKNIVP
ncbi:acyltransferase [Alkalimarinus sediminis]|uniref:Acyltransferase family protein n=1 Tax=Alkalimarinus sediminis TaxID=1632866 RepID=A0A9E8HKL4_9ALTE|nr:acyltransferase family protein [Alkalimarinus sediminis]UZW76164.1 acyltransferase family protein [Alkalimarinus sediminis]